MGDNSDLALGSDQFRTLPFDERINILIERADAARARGAAAQEEQIAAARNWLTLAEAAEKRLINLLATACSLSGTPKSAAGD